jgi:hypothetical protein
MISGTVALDSEDISARLLRMPDAKIDPEASSTDLMITGVAKTANYSGNIGLKWAVWQFARGLRLRNLSAACKFEEALENPRSVPTGPVGINVVRVK